MMKTFGPAAMLAALLVNPALAQAPAAPAPAAPPAAPRAPPFPAPIPYGPTITYEQAHKVLDAALEEAAKRKVSSTIAILDNAGGIVYYEKPSSVAYNAKALAVQKGFSSARTTRASKFEADRYPFNAGILAIDDVFPFAGGQAIVAGGKMIGAIGVTGGDDPVALAGVAAVK